MGSLTGCLRKLGKNVSPEDRAAIQDLAAGFRRDGMQPADAGKAAVRAHMEGLAGEMEALRGQQGNSASALEKPTAGTDSGSTAGASLDTQLAQRIATEQPDLQVVLPGTEQSMPIAEALARIAEEQKQEGQWAELVRVAAECALSA